MRVNQFLDQIKDNKYEVKVTNLRMNNGKTLETCIEAILHHDLVSSHHRVQEHRFIKIRHFHASSLTPGPEENILIMDREHPDHG